MQRVSYLRFTYWLLGTATIATLVSLFAQERSGLVAFGITCIALLALPLIAGVIDLIQSWTFFLIFGRKTLSRAFTRQFSSMNYPRPGLGEELDEFLLSTFNDKRNNDALRLNAARFLGALDGLKLSGGLTAYLQSHMAGRDALDVYRMDFLSKTLEARIADTTLRRSQLEFDD